MKYEYKGIIYEATSKDEVCRKVGIYPSYQNQQLVKRLIPIKRSNKPKKKFKSITSPYLEMGLSCTKTMFQRKGNKKEFKTEYPGFKDVERLQSKKRAKTCPKY